MLPIEWAEYSGETVARTKWAELYYHVTTLSAEEPIAEWAEVEWVEVYQ